jgi:hypothetical protein
MIRPIDRGIHDRKSKLLCLGVGLLAALGACDSRAPKLEAAASPLESLVGGSFLTQDELSTVLQLFA